MGTHPCNNPLKPGPALQLTLQDVQDAFEDAGIECWLCFGALFGLVKNDGIIPDADFDFCCRYRSDEKKLIKAMERKGYSATKIMMDDRPMGSGLYCGFQRSEMPHVCVSFWWEHEGVCYYCHDQRNEIRGEMPPPSGFWFKGIPADLLQPNMFKMVEWPGLQQSVKVRVPMYAGTILDYCYPCWAYTRQRCTVNQGTVNRERLQSVYRGHAISPYMVHVESMRQWENQRYINDELEKGRTTWERELKRLVAEQ